MQIITALIYTLASDFTPSGTATVQFPTSTAQFQINPRGQKI